MSDTDTDRRYERIMESIRTHADLLNRVLGIAADDQHRVTVGYVGNVDVTGRNDSRVWSIFLPHPGRVGTSGDRIGSWRTGDAADAKDALTRLSGALTLARWSVDPSVAVPMEEQRAARYRRERAARQQQIAERAAAEGIDWTPPPLDDTAVPSAVLVNGEWTR